MAVRIAIVGGGPGGLMTASLLHRLTNQPVTLTLLEAAPRIGGKVLTRQFNSLPVSYEAGAAEFYDYSHIDSDPLKELISDLGLSITTMGGNSVFLNGKRYSTLEDVADGLGQEVRNGWQRFHNAAQDSISPREFYASDNSELVTVACPADQSVIPPRFDSLQAQITPSALHTFLATMIHSDLAAEWSQTDVTYGLQNYLMNHPRYMQLYSIAGGNEQLIHRLAESTPMQLKLEHQVLSVERLSDGQMRLQIRHQQQIHAEDFDYVVLCLPIQHLHSLTFPAPALAAAMQRHLQQFDHPAHYLRVTLLFRQPFWKTWLTDSWCMLDAWGGCCLYDETSRQPDPECGILGWLFGGDAAVELSSLTDEQLIRTALDTLPASHQLAQELLLEGHVHRWINAVSALPGGEQPTRLDLRHQPDPADHPRLFVTGDYLFDSTLNGVLDSAECVASWIVAELENRPLPNR